MLTLHAHATGSIALSVLAASAACAAPPPIRPSTSLHRCGQETCVLITGRRGDAGAPVLIAGHRMVAQGERRWRVTVPLSAVREWSAPAARSVTVEVAGEGATQATLPIGLLGHVTEMAYLDVSARR